VGVEAEWHNGRQQKAGMEYVEVKVTGGAQAGARAAGAMPFTWRAFSARSAAACAVR